MKSNEALPSRLATSSQARGNKRGRYGGNLDERLTHDYQVKLLKFDDVFNSLKEYSSSLGSSSYSPRVRLLL